VGLRLASWGQRVAVSGQLQGTKVDADGDRAVSQPAARCMECDEASVAAEEQVNGSAQQQRLRELPPPEASPMAMEDSSACGGPHAVAEMLLGATGVTTSPGASGEQPLAREEMCALQQQVSPAELMKWSEMIDNGLSQCIQAHPDRFHRRVRRGIPPKFRWQVWKAAVRLHEQNDILEIDYKSLSRDRNPWTDMIEIDIGRTFPELKTFTETQQQQLLRVLNAYAAYNPKVGYCQGMNFVVGLLLLVSDYQEEETFGVLVCFMDHGGLSGFYRERLPLLRRYLRAFDKLVQETVPELREHFIKEDMQPAVYLHGWFLTLFINCFPLSMVTIIWDVIICEGLPVILRIAVSILQVLNDSLLTMHFEEIIKFFKMMKTYDDEGGDLNAVRIGQLLMKHTELVHIPDSILGMLNRDDDDASVDSDETWEADLAGSGWLTPLMRMFSFSGAKRRGGSVSSISDGTTPSEREPARLASQSGGGNSPSDGNTARGGITQRIVNSLAGGSNSPSHDVIPCAAEDRRVEEFALSFRGWEFL